MMNNNNSGGGATAAAGGGGVIMATHDPLWNERKNPMLLGAKQKDTSPH